MKEKVVNKLTVYRIKSSFMGNELSDNAVVFGRISDDITIYYSKSQLSKPAYLTNFFKFSNDKINEFCTSSSKILVLVKNVDESEELAFAFGSGRFLLNTDAIDDRFGLRTALNIVNSEEIKDFSKTVLESNPKNTKEQLAKTANTSEFGISSEQDLIKGITGKIKSKWSSRLGNFVSGSESLTLRISCDIDDISTIASNIVEAYKSEEYKENFDWVDQIRNVKDREVIQELNNNLVQSLSSQEDGGRVKAWAAVPDYIDYIEIDKFKIGTRKQSKAYNDIEKRYIIEALDNKISLEALKNLKISAISSENDTATIAQWRAYNCLYAEVSHGESIFLLINGRWYEISADFCSEIDQAYRTVVLHRDYIAYKHENEAAYNVDLAKTINGKCYDCRTIRYGSSHSRIEICDVQTKDGDLVHVKKYTGSSALSHLFNQGYVSGELIRNDPDFVLKANKETGGDFTKTPSDRNRKIIFAIITRKPRNFDIPFFSKVTLRNIKRQLTGLGYDIEMQLIENTKE